MCSVVHGSSVGWVWECRIVAIVAEERVAVNCSDGWRQLGTFSRSHVRARQAVPVLKPC